MEQQEIVQIVEDAEKKVKTVKDMLADCNACASETSKTVLLAAMSKIAAQLKPQTQH